MLACLPQDKYLNHLQHHDHDLEQKNSHIRKFVVVQREKLLAFFFTSPANPLSEFFSSNKTKAARWVMGPSPFKTPNRNLIPFLIPHPKYQPTKKKKRKNLSTTNQAGQPSAHSRRAQKKFNTRGFLQIRDRVIDSMLLRKWPMRKWTLRALT